MESHASENKHILAVDDDSDVVTMVEQALQIHGFKVSAFTDAAMALEHFSKLNFSIAFNPVRRFSYSSRNLSSMYLLMLSFAYALLIDLYLR
jgi:DNA-binding NtrC family response regulator